MIPFFTVFLWFFRYYFHYPVTVFYFLGNGRSWGIPQSHYLTVISTIYLLYRDDFLSQMDFHFFYLKESGVLLWLHSIFLFLHPLFGNFQMAENLRRGMQDINLGADEPLIPLPVNVVNEAAAGNQFILIGRPVMPRRQNIRSITATLPRNWGHVGVYGRMLEGRQFQFVFPFDKSLEMILHRVPGILQIGC